MRLSALTAARDTLTACFMVGHDDLFGNLFACFKTGAKLDHRLGLSLLDYVDHFPVLSPGYRRIFMSDFSGVWYYINEWISFLRLT
jgi:hypothetical protein